MDTPLLATKLYRPLPRPGSVHRPRLLAQLGRGLQLPCTLLAAPAGSGKTTLLSQALADGARPVAWLTLGDDDGEIPRFLAYLIAALQTAAPQLGAGALASLLAPQPPPAAALLPGLINELAALAHPLVLVLDDYHRAESPPVDQALALLLAQLPPQLHLVIATREEPQLRLAELRARGQLAELRAADLRFTRDEAAELLNHAAGLSLSAEDIGTLEQHTEGWAAGLQLAALSLQGQPDAAGLLRSFSGSHRFVLDYLLEAVLTRQPAPIQQFLLRTSILGQLCGPLCDAVCGQDAGRTLKDTHSTEALSLHPSSFILQELERTNLFLVPLDDERRWYRYHHLFGEFLQQRLAQSAGVDDIAGLHARASAWYASAGLDLAALRHAAAAADPARVADLAEQSWRRMDSSFQSADWCRWVRQLPEPVLRARPVLCTQYAWALMDAGEVDASEARLRDAERWLGAPAEPEQMIVVAKEQLAALPAQIAIARAYLAQTRGDAAGATRHAAAALELTPADDPLLRAQAESVLGMACWAGGALEPAYRALAHWVEYTRQAGNLAFALASGFYLAEIRLAQGQLREAARLYRQFLQLAPAGDAAIAHASPHLHLGLALVAHEQGDDAAAALHLRASKEQGNRAALLDWPFRWRLAQARLAESAGNWEAALDWLDEAGRLYVRNPVPDLRPVAALKAQIYLRQGRLAAALAWAAERGLAAADELTYLSEFEHMTLARVLIARYRHERAGAHMHAALGLLARLLAAAEARGRARSAIEILLLQALAHDALGDHGRALPALDRALVLAAPEGYQRLFVDEGPPLARLLEARRALGRDPLRAYCAALLAALQRSAGLAPGVGAALI